MYFNYKLLLSARTCTSDSKAAAPSRTTAMPPCRQRNGSAVTADNASGISWRHRDSSKSATDSAAAR